MKFSKPQSYILTTTKQIVLAMFGVGSGKTHMIGFKSGYLIINFPQATGFIGANTHKQLDKSTLNSVRKRWQEIYGWVKGEDYVEGVIPPTEWGITTDYKNYNNLIVFKNGAIVMTGSMENAKAIDGVEFSWAFLDETKEGVEVQGIDTDKLAKVVGDTTELRGQTAELLVSDESSFVQVDGNTDLPGEEIVPPRMWKYPV